MRPAAFNRSIPSGVTPHQRFPGPYRFPLTSTSKRLPGPGFFEAQARRRAKSPRTVFGFVGGPSQIKGWPVMRAAFERLFAR